MYKKFIKRFLDILISFVILVLFCWLYLILAVLVRVKLGSPVLFKQPRPGKDEKIFNMYKFRTMTDARDKEGKLLPDSERLTSFGKLLRKTSLDELPELFCILKGDMSFIGPRPFIPDEDLPNSKIDKKRYLVRPGVTGLAYVNGGKFMSHKSKLKYDSIYYDNFGFIQDLKIILKTPIALFKQSKDKKSK